MRIDTGICCWTSSPNTLANSHLGFELGDCLRRRSLVNDRLFGFLELRAGGILQLFDFFRGAVRL
jgi:hypothetical protein